MEHTNTFCRHPAGQSREKQKHNLWISYRRVIWNTKTHFVDILHESQAEHINTLCGHLAGESYGTNKHTSFTSSRIAIRNTRTQFVQSCRRFTWNTQIHFVDILQVRNIEYTNTILDIVQESHLEHKNKSYGHPAEIPKLKPGGK